MADFYKTALTIPVAFKTAAQGSHELESRVRHTLRDAFADARLLGRIVDDIRHVFMLDDKTTAKNDELETRDDDAGALWDPDGGDHPGGVNWGGSNSSDPKE